MILAWNILEEIELVSHVPTMLSQLIQAWIVDGDDTNGDDRVNVPSMNPETNLFLASKIFLTERT